MKELRRSNSTGRLPEIDLENGVQEVGTNDTVHKKAKGKFIKEYLIDFTANSNLHGLRYIGEKKRTYAEKIFWLFMFVLCVIYCAYLIRKVWIKWDESPVMVSFAESLTPAWQIPFPAITICFQSKASSKRFNFTKYYKLYDEEDTKANLTEKETQMVEDFSMACKKYVDSDKNFTDGKITVGNIKDLSVDFGDFLNYCLWKDTPICEKIFSPIVMEEGLCQTFNMLGPDELFRMENLHKDYEYMNKRNSNSTQSWTLEAGYPPSTPLETYPYRGSGNGGKDNLVVGIYSYNLNMDYTCNMMQGFKIYLHSPAELPSISRHSIQFPLSQDLLVAVKPKMMTATEGLKDYSSQRRQCYFSNERYLRFFKIYTQSNCELECLANFTNAKCGCVHFGLPHGPGVKTCGAGSMYCLSSAQTELVQLEVQSSIDGHTSDKDTVNEALAVAGRCSCLPACTSIEYAAETSQANVDMNAFLIANNIPLLGTDLTVSRLKVYLKEPQFTTLRRSELYGQVDFLANCGGLLGLFMGFSVLSVAEIIYFLTLRWWCLFTKNRRIHGVQ
ncbi:pickpocket protein 28-like [Epargyreus clarus]|uniref:pickpocket protein 28-like n=1 Tax=Epargyreus clarus TaxID=520877 RepID=UPI003C3060C2